MGKTNKANRTKGNTRPSNSEHSAHLLTRSGKSLSGFIGFDSLEKDIPCYIPVTGQHSTEAADFSVDSDFRMVMRKMLKRDSITRLKAVQEFGDLCSEKDIDIVKNVLPFYPRLFNKLALDYDRRIREAIHQANGKLLSTVKREIAPYLKNIMGVWLLGQNDLHAPAASAAQASFINTFPKAKQSEALMYCRNEIFSLFKDNLFEQTAKSMSDPSFISAEDIENKYTLVISATLQAMKLFLVTVSSDEVSNAQEDYVAIISENKFWKYAKNKESQIRGSWYTLISYLCHVKPDIFSGMEKKLVSAVFGCLSDSDPVVAPVIWESALHVVINFGNCWEEINVQKAVIPQIWTLLNEAGSGNAHVVYPCILPFLSKFPREIISKETFILQFFSCLKNSLLLDSVKSSSMECDAILTTFMESIQYISFCILDSTKEGPLLLDKILSDYVLPLVETSFYESKHVHLATSKLYPLLGSFIQKIENKYLNNGENEVLSQTLAFFWNKMYTIFCKVFEKKESEQVKISIYITYFFHSVFTPSPVLVKSEKSKVRFEDEKSDICLPQTTNSFLPKDLYRKMPLSFMHATKFVKILCAKIDENINLCYLKILDEFLACTLSTEFIKDILETCTETYVSSGKMGLTFFNQIIFKWITIPELNTSCIECISDIIFTLCSLVSEDEALEMLNICCTVNNPIFIENILSKGLGKYVHEPVMQNWLKSPTLAEYVLHGWKEMMKSLTEDETIIDESVIFAHRNKLVMSLVNKDLQGSLKEKKQIEEILIVCKEFMEKGLNCKNVDCIMSISCSIIEAVLLNCKECWEYSVTDNLLSVLFHWKLNKDEFGFSEITHSAILQAWQSAILSAYKNNVITRKDSFLMTAAEELCSSLCCLKTSEKATHIYNEIVNLLHTVANIEGSLPGSYSFILSYILENILPSDSNWQKLREGLAFSSIPSAIKRKFMYYPKTENHAVPQEGIHNLFLATKTVLSVFTTEIDKYSSCESEQYFEEFIVKYLYDLLWCLSYCSGNGYVNEDFEMEFKENLLDSQLEKILKFLSFKKLKDILRNIFYSSLSKGLNWALPFQLLSEKIKTLYPESETLFDALIFEAYLLENDYESLNIQILSHYVSREKKNYYLKNLLGSLTSKHSCKDINKDFLEKLAEICCFLQNPEVLEEDIKTLLSVFFTMFPIPDYPNDSSLYYLEFLSLISSVVEQVPSAISRNSWKFLQNFVAFSIKNGKTKMFDKPDDLFFLYQASLAYLTSFSFMCANENTEMSWTPTVSDEINEGFVSLFIHICDTIKKFSPLPQAFEVALGTLLKSVEYIPEKVIFNYIMQSPLSSNEINSVEKKDSCLDNLLSILLSDVPYLQLAAHLMLIKVMPLLSESLSSESKCECSDSEDEEEKVPSKLSSLVDTLNILNELIEGMLWDIKIGECCLVMPNTEPFAFVSAYLFAWLQMLEFISASPSQLRSGYVAHLEETKLLSSLFSNVCRLMPENPLSCIKKSSSSDSPKKDSLFPHAYVTLFLHAPQIYAGEPSSTDIQVFACHTFCTAMRKVPASVRTWWNNLDKKSADIVNKFTSKYISGILCSEEIQAVYNNENLFQNMMVKARLGTREVIATYTVDDFSIELYVQLPANYPLGQITAEKRGSIVIPHQEWRHWLMQLSTVLNYQNGSILDGLNIWKKNLDKKFEGVEECMICYYILHNSSMKLPKLSCHTCRKKFHSACLYKWFQSINNSKCPLCRNEFTI